MITFGNTEITKAYLGNTEINKVYLGEDLVFGGSSPTPILHYDAEVEYLQSSGTQYIQMPDITYSSENKYAFEGHLFFPTSPTNNPLMGWDAGGAFGWLRNKGWWNGYSTNSYISAPYNTNAKVALIVNSGTNTQSVLSIEGYSSLSRAHSSLATYAKTHPYTLFALWSNNSITKISIRIKDFTIYVNDSKVYDLIAVRKNGVGYMYDKVSQTLFGNDGTGDFTYGNDIT